MRVRELGLRLGGALELLARLLEPVRAQQHRAEVVERRGVLGTADQGLRDALLRGGQVAALQRDDTRQVGGVEQSGHLFEHPAVRRLRLVEAARLVQRDRLVQQVGDGRLRRLLRGYLLRGRHQTSRCELAAATTEASA